MNMHFEFDSLGDHEKLALAKTLGVGPSRAGKWILQVSDANADQLILAARIHCLSKVHHAACRRFNNNLNLVPLSLKKKNFFFSQPAQNSFSIRPRKRTSY